MAQDISSPEYFYFIFVVIIVIVISVVIIFHLPIHSGRTVALGSTQPQIKINTSGVSWGVKAA
jgi:hypothetical protein